MQICYIPLKIVVFHHLFNDRAKVRSFFRKILQTERKYESLAFTGWLYRLGSYRHQFAEIKRWFYQTASISALLIYALSFYLVSIVFRSLPVGLVYAVWSGVGIILTAMVAYFAFGQKLDMPTMLGIALIISGVLVINLFSTTNH